MIRAAARFNRADDVCPACLNAGADLILLILKDGRGRHVRALRRAVNQARPDTVAVRRALSEQSGGADPWSLPSVG